MQWSNILEKLFLFIDSIVYTILEFSYKIFQMASQLSLRNTGTILDTLISRIMALVTVFMLFRLVVILVEYLTNPNRTLEKYNSKTPINKVITNIFVTLALLILVYSNFIFGLLHDFQLLIFYDSSISKAEFEVLDDLGFELEDTDVIRNVIFGKKSEDYKFFGRTIGVEVLSSLLYMDYGDGNIQPWGGTKTEEGEEIGLCSPGYFNKGNDEKTLCNIARGYEKYDFHKLADLNEANKYLYYYPIISTLAGGFIAYSLFNATIYIFVRMFQMFFLEMLSPVAVVSNIDPSKGKTVFKNYVGLYLKTFLDLFMRISIIYLTILFIQEGVLKIFSSEGILGDGLASGFISGNTLLNIPGLGQSKIIVGGIDFSILLLKVFSLMAVFYFLQKVPDLLYGILGIKHTKEQDLFGSTIRSVLGLGAGVATGIVTPLVKHGAPGALISPFKGISSGIRGLQAGYNARGYGELQSKIKGTFGNDYSSALTSYNARMQKSASLGTPSKSSNAPAGTSTGSAPATPGGTVVAGSGRPVAGTNTSGGGRTTGGTTTSSGSGATSRPGGITTLGGGTAPSTTGGSNTPGNIGTPGSGITSRPTGESGTPLSSNNEMGYRPSSYNDYFEYINKLEAKLKLEVDNTRLLNAINKTADEEYYKVAGRTKEEVMALEPTEKYNFQLDRDKWLTDQLKTDSVTVENKEIKNLLDEYKENGNKNIDSSNGLYQALDEHQKNSQVAQEELAAEKSSERYKNYAEQEVIDAQMEAMGLKLKAENEKQIRQMQAEADEQLKEAQAKTDEQLKEVQAETDRQLKETQAEAEEQIKQVQAETETIKEKLDTLDE